MHAKHAPNQAKAAEALGVSVDTFRKWLPRGCPRKTKRGWPIDRIREWRERTLGPSHRGAPKDPAAAAKLLLAQADERRAKADLAELKLQIERGEYRSLRDIEEWDRARITVVKRGLLGLARSLAPVLVGMDAKAIEQLIYKRCRELLERFARMK